MFVRASGKAFNKEISHLDKNNVLHKSQFVFGSLTHCLMAWRVVAFWMAAFVDLSKACNHIALKILLIKLEYYGL